VSVPTPERLRKQARRLDRRIRSTETVLNAMRKEALCTCSMAPTVPCGCCQTADALQLSGARSQTYRFIED
jgi:hypothetical protein